MSAIDDDRLVKKHREMARYEDACAPAVGGGFLATAPRLVFGEMVSADFFRALSPSLENSKQKEQLRRRLLIERTKKSLPGTSRTEFKRFVVWTKRNRPKWVGYSWCWRKIGAVREKN